MRAACAGCARMNWARRRAASGSGGAMAASAWIFASRSRRSAKSVPGGKRAAKASSRTVDTVIAAMEANHPNLTTQKTLYVEISRARDRAELVTDDKAALREQLEVVTGERITALEAIGEDKAKARELSEESGREVAKGSETAERTSGREPEKALEPKSVDRGLGL